MPPFAPHLAQTGHVAYTCLHTFRSVVMRPHLERLHSWVWGSQYLEAVIQRWRSHAGTAPPKQAIQLKDFRTAIDAVLHEPREPARITYAKDPDKIAQRIPIQFWQMPPALPEMTQQQRTRTRLRAAYLLLRKTGTKQTTLLGVTNTNQASNIIRERAHLPLDSIPSAAKHLHCTPEWLAGSDMIRLCGKELSPTATAMEWAQATIYVPGDIWAVINRLAFVEAPTVQAVLDLKTHLPGTMTNTPGWLHPFLIVEAVGLDQCTPHPHLAWLSDLTLPEVHGSDGAEPFGDDAITTPNLDKLIKRLLNS